MPEAGRTPTAQYERGDSLAYGQASAANQLAGLAAPVREPEPYAPTGDEEEFLYSQTDRPAEPLTQGVPAGPGADFTRHAIETDDDFKHRVAASILSRPGVSRETKAWATRAAAGE